MNAATAVPDDYLEPIWPDVTDKLSSWKDLVCQATRQDWLGAASEKRAGLAAGFQLVAERWMAFDASHPDPGLAGPAQD